MKGLRFVLIWLVIGVLVFPGCKKHKVPNGFPDPETMAEIVAELHIVESTLNYGSNYAFRNQHNQPGYYRSILEKYGLTAEQFDTIRKWYVDNPEIYQYVYDQSIVILSKKEAEVRIAMEQEQEEERKRREELRKRPSSLWTGSNRFKVAPSDTFDQRLPFRFITDTLEIEGRLRLTAFYKFLKEDVSQSPRMMLSAFYADSTADTVYQEVTHSFRKKGTILNLELKDSSKLMEVNGFLLLQDSPYVASVEVDNISLLVIRDSNAIDVSDKLMKLEPTQE
jgi:hypothetical protein